MRKRVFMRGSAVIMSKGHPLPGQKAGLGASAESPFSPNTPFMPCFIPPQRLRDWLGSHSTAWHSHPPVCRLPRYLLSGGKREMLLSHKDNELRKSSALCCHMHSAFSSRGGGAAPSPPHAPRSARSPCAPLLLIPAGLFANTHRGGLHGPSLFGVRRSHPPDLTGNPLCNPNHIAA